VMIPEQIRSYLHRPENYYRLLDDAFYENQEKNIDYNNCFSRALELAEKEMEVKGDTDEL